MPSDKELKRCRLDNVPKDWSVERLDNIATTEYGVSETANDSPNASMLGMKHLSNGKIEFSDLVPIAVDDDTKARYRLMERDLLFNRTNSLEQVGKTAIVTQLPSDDILFASYLVRIDLDRSKALPEFVNYFMNSHIGKSRIKSLATPGVSQCNVNPTSLKKHLLVPLPCLQEQRVIVDVLKTWDKAIMQLEELLSLKKDQLKCLQHFVFQTKETDLKPLSEFLIPTKRPVPKPSSAYTALGLRSHCKGTFQRRVDDPSTVAMDTLYSVQASELIVNITFAWEGAIAFVKPEDADCLVSHRFPTYQVNEKKADFGFVQFLVTTPRFVFELGKISPGGAGRNRVMSKKDFLKLKVSMPGLARQQEVGITLCTADNEIRNIQHRISLLHMQKNGLMQNLLSGDVRCFFGNKATA
ncbi:restriction endonuclease subunit S [bacterium]|nr:restriction endonuclease subunit S [bacterium]